MEVLGKDTVLNLAEKVTKTKQWKAKLNEGSKVVINTRGKHWKENTAKEAARKLKPEVKMKHIFVLIIPAKMKPFLSNSVESFQFLNR